MGPVEGGGSGSALGLRSLSVTGFLMSLTLSCVRTWKGAGDNPFLQGSG